MKERNASGARRARGSTSPRDELDFAGWDGVFHLAGQPGVARASATSSRSTSSGTCSRASGSSRPRPRRASASSSPRRRRSTARRSATRRPRRRRRSRSRPTGSRSSPASTSRARSARSLGLDAVVLRYFTVYGPRQRPDMAFTRDRRARSPRATVHALRRRRAEPELHVRRRRRRGQHRARWSAAGAGAIYNVGGGEEATMNEAIALLEQHLRRRARRRAGGGGRGRPAPDEGGHDADPRRPRLGAEHRPWRTGLRAQWEWAAVESPRVNRPEPVPDPDAEREVDLRSVWERIAARWWLPVLGRRPRARDRLRARARRRQGLRGRDARRLGQPFTPNGGARDPELPRDEPARWSPRSSAPRRRSKEAARGERPAVGALRGNVSHGARRAPRGQARGRPSAARRDQGRRGTRRARPSGRPTRSRER